MTILRHPLCSPFCMDGSLGVVLRHVEAIPLTFRPGGTSPPETKAELAEGGA